MSVLAALTELVFAPSCVSCGNRLDCVAAAFCDTCAISLYPIESACPGCAIPSESSSPRRCAACRRAPRPYAAASASFLYGGELACALRKLKFSRREDIARSLAPLIADDIARAATDSDTIIPVPLHWRRLSQRGFNQADALVRHAAQSADCPIDCLSLRRVRATPPQTGLTARGRAKNVDGCFAVTARRSAHVSGRRVLLVDDVVTTGATVSAAARALLKAGARHVAVYSVARAEPP